MASTIQQFLKEHGISEVEAIIPDMAGVARGKLMPAEKFAEEEGMRLPEAIFLQTVTGDYPEDQSAMNPSDIDIVLKADPKTVQSLLRYSKIQTTLDLYTQGDSDETLSAQGQFLNAVGLTQRVQ